MKKILHSFTLLQVMTCLFFASNLSGQGPEFREGYVIMKYGDTLRGLIKNRSAEEILFKDSRNYKKNFYPDDLKGFSRCNMDYISALVPGDTAKIFVAHLLQGTIDLYATIVPENYSDAVLAGVMFGGLTGAFIGALADAANASTGTVSHASECEKEHYSIGRFYLRKGGNDILRKVPNGRKKFNDFMIPLMRDQVQVLRDIPEAMFFAGNTISIVRQYNAAAGK